jgi:hypothetical protein
MRAGRRWDSPSIARGFPPAWARRRSTREDPVGITFGNQFEVIGQRPGILSCELQSDLVAIFKRLRCGAMMARETIKASEIHPL